MKVKLYIGKEETVQEQNGGIITFTSSPASGGTDSISFDYYTNYPLTNTISTITVPLLAVPSPYSNEQMASDFKSIVTALSNNLTATYVSGDTFVTIVMNNGSPIFNYVFSNSFGNGVENLVDVVVTNYKKIDLFEDENIEFTSKLNDIEKLSNVFTDFTNSFTVPANDINNELFQHYYDIDNDNTLNANIRALAYLEIDSLPLRYGKLQLEGVTLKNQRPDNYKVTFYGNIVQLNDLFGDDTLDRLDYVKNEFGKFVKVYNGLSDLDYEASATNLRRSMQDPTFKNGDVQLPLIQCSDRDINYGTGDGTDISAPLPGLRRRELRPGIRVTKLIELIENKYNISFSRDFIGQAMFKNIYMWCGSKEQASGNYQTINVAASPTKIAQAAALGFVVDTVNDTLSFTRTEDNQRYVRFVFNPLFESLETPYQIALFNNGGLVQEFPQTKDYSVNILTNDGLNEFSIAMKSPSYMEYTYTIELFSPADNDSVTLDVGLYQYFGGVSFQDTIPKFKVIDFITGIMKAFKLIIRPLSPTSFYLNTIDGFYNDGTLIDITDYVDQNEVIVNKPSLYKTIDLKFKETKNVLGARFRENNDGIGYGDLKAEYNIDDKNSLTVEVPFENMLFERMINSSNNEVTNILFGQAVTVNEETSEVKLNKSEPCLYFSNGITDISNTPIYAVHFLTPIKLDYIHLIGNTNDALLPQVTDTLNFGAENDPWHLSRVDNSLYLNYWENWIETIYDLKQRKITFKSNNLPSRYVQELSLNDRLIIGNQRYKINDFTVNLTDGSSNFTAFKDIYDWNEYSFPREIITQERSFTPNGWYYTDYASTNDNVFLYGSFTGYNGNSYGRVIKLNVDCSVDETFNTGSGFNNNTFAFQSMLLQDDGKLMFAGNFTNFNGTSFGRIVRLTSTGQIDTTFNSAVGFSNITSAVKIDSQGKYYVGGSYSSYSGVSANRIIKLNSNGTIDTFNSGTGFNNVTNDILINEDDSLYVSGYFTSYNGTAKSRLVKLNSDGTIDTSFANGTFTTGANDPIGMVESNGLICYGYFTAYSGVSANRIIKLNANGSINQQFLDNVGTGFNNILYNTKIIFGDKLLVKGTFTTYNGVSSLGVIILNNDGTIYRTFDIAYQNVYTIGNKVYGNLLNGPQVLIFDNDIPAIFTSNIQMNAGSKYFGINIITKDDWSLSNLIDYGYGTDWVEFDISGGTGSNEFVFKVKDKTNQTAPDVNNPRFLTMLIKIGDINYGINVTQNGLT